MTLLIALAVALCITGSGLAAGLTIGLLSLDQFDMLVLLETDPEHCDTEEERLELLAEQADARLVHPLLENHHRLLVTLLLLNCLCAEMLPLFLDRLFPPWVAVLLSVTFILMFGEIIPSAVFSNSKSGLANSAKMAGLVHMLLVVAAPVAIPIGWVLDWAVGESDDGTYSKPELRSLLRLHQSEKHLTPQQSKMMAGAMDLMTTKVFQAMTPTDKLFMLSTEAVLDQSTLAHILGRGYTRIPVYSPSEGEEDGIGQIIGMLLAVSLIAVDSTDLRRVGDMGLRHPPVISPHITLHDVLDYNAPFFLVSDQPEAFAKAMRGRHSPRLDPPATEEPPKLLGCISSQDVIKCLTKHPMRDEFSNRKNESSDEDENDGGERTRSEEQDDLELGPEATKRVKQWIARARTKLKDHSQVEHYYTERTKLLPPGKLNKDLAAAALAEVWLKHKRSRLLPKKSSSTLRFSQV
ncbi:hypothetical protein BASA81_004511 [Batrachochytrium salamandrivorans]|nr:hypothetical protein BASA81_004511 [Batrachochytrium salamandrivorans]